MFGISGPELLVVAIIALLVFGPEKLPELARTAGKLAGQFRRQSDAVRREFYNTVYRPAADLQSRVNLETRALKTLTDTSRLADKSPNAASSSGDTAPQASAGATAGTDASPVQQSLDSGTADHHDVEKPRDPQ